MFEEIYHEYLVHKNEQNRKERYEGNESWYHASGAGFCSRKLYYESVEKVFPTNEPAEINTRVMRLGTVIHQDIQDAIIYYNNIYSKENINKEITKDKLSEQYMSWITKRLKKTGNFEKLHQNECTPFFNVIPPI